MRIGETVPHQFIQAHRFLRERDLTGIGFGEECKSVHDFRQPVNLVELCGEKFAVGARSGRVAQLRLDLAAHDGERRLQFVRGMEREFPDVIEGIVQPLGHGVEHFGEAVQFVAVAAARQSLIEVVRLDAFHGVSEGRDRRESAAHQKPSSNQRQRKGRQPAVEHHFAEFLERGVAFARQSRTHSWVFHRHFIVGKATNQEQSHQQDGCIPEQELRADSHAGTCST